jgi:predicted anti-sigma-YlaC factor YlaD
MNDRTEGEVRCIEFVEEITSYLDGAIDPIQRGRIEQHLAGCAGCRAALDQVQSVIRIAGHLTAADVATIAPLIRDQLLETVRRPRRR